jgi:hypothetical protein
MSQPKDPCATKSTVAVAPSEPTSLYGLVPSICQAASPMRLWQRYLRRLSFEGEPLLEQRWMAERSVVQRNFLLGYSALLVVFGAAQALFAYNTTVYIGGIEQGHREKALAYAAVALCFSLGVLLGTVALARPGFARLEAVALASSIVFVACCPIGFTWRSVAVLTQQRPDDEFVYTYPLRASSTEPALMLVSYFTVTMNLLCGLVRARWAPVLCLVAVVAWIAWILALPGGYVRSCVVEPGTLRLILAEASCPYDPVLRRQTTRRH